MKVILGCDIKSVQLKNSILAELYNMGIEVEDTTPDGVEGFYDMTVDVVNKVLEDLDNNRGIIIDEFGVGPFMVADKFKYIICAELNDEHSAKMTRDHNNANVITIGSNVVGTDVAKHIVERFVTHEYAGGRHQIRVDMLNKMC